MKVEIASCVGTAGFADSVQPNIERSPIRDVAIGEEEVIADDAADAHHFPKHRWLQRAYQYHSCIAVPVHSPSEYAYSLFAFDAQKRQFSESMYPRIRRAAAEVAHVLHAQRVEARLLSIEPYELLGRSYGSMSHDLRHLLANESTTRRLLGLVAGRTELAGRELEQLQAELSLLDERLRQAAEIVRTFGEVARGTEQQEEEVVLLPLVESYVAQFGRQHRILRKELLVARDYPLELRVRIRPMGLRQVLFNLVLNAVQQIALFEIREPNRGEIVVELAQEDREDGLWASIRVHDTGPGIHRADFDRVFDLGYTTKKGGFGMGLDICRRITRRVEVEGRRGEVRVSNSILFAGTTFSVSLPLPKTQEPLR
jgi:signal transduction histidine kinase